MEKGTAAELQLEALKMLLNNRVTAEDVDDEMDEDEDSEENKTDGISGGCLNAFLESICIIFEKCSTKEECTEALVRIQQALQSGN